MQHTYFVHFFCRCFARLQRETSRNFLVTRFMEEMSYVFSFTFFFHCRSISPSALVAASISYFLTATTKLSCCSSNKKNVSFSCLSLSLDLCCPFSGWASLACRLLSLFLCLSLPLFSKFVDVTVNLSLIVQTTRIHGNNSRFPFSTLRSNDADVQRERKKKSLISKTSTSHVHHTFLYISLPFLHDYDVKIPNFLFHGERKQATTELDFSFWAWIWSLEIQLREGLPTFFKVSAYE